MSTPPLAAVTGASEGLGKEFARQLAAEGYNLLVIARRENLLHELKADLEAKYNVQVEPFGTVRKLNPHIVTLFP